MGNNEGAVRKRSIPSRYVGKNVKQEDITEWARKELNGEEPEFLGPFHKKELFDKIKAGEITEVTIRPKKSGFFLPDGTFVEAYKYSPGIGDDLEQAEEKWNVEEKNNEWADQENEIFNKKAIANSKRMGELFWEHGKRIEEYAKNGTISPASILHLLDDRKTQDSYSRHSHQTGLDFYRWKPNIEKDSPMFEWSWERIDTVLRFSNNLSVRDFLAELISTTELGLVSDEQLARLLGVKTRKQDLTIDPANITLLVEIRRKIKERENIDKDLIKQATKAVGFIKKPN